ncbi:MAG: hypothetical protein P1U56_16000 [Saprospiraceae bacterium]|nr:hypothetical protein [Saprospiraceae bacterium]
MGDVFILKGEIEVFVKKGNKSEVRIGALHYLPHEKVYINSNRKNVEDARFENRISVVGKSRFGNFKHSKIHFKYLKFIVVEEVLNPNMKTQEFIDKVGLFKFQKGSPEHKIANQILDLFNKYKAGL